MAADFTYYDILGVSETASQADIKAAYHSAVLKYHPDVNTAPNAQRLTAILNEAYGILSDPEKRASYDANLRLDSSSQGPSDEAQAIWDLYTCDRCGNFNPHLRFATFFKVWSIIFYTKMNGVGGVLCPDCRSKYAVETAAFSAFLGPWGFPWGIFYTFRALIASVRAGELPRQLNAELLRHQGIALLQRDRVNEARTSLNSSLWFEKNDAVTNLLNEEVFNGSRPLPVPGWLQGQSISLGLFLLAPILVVVVLMMIGSSGSGSSANQSVSSTTQTSNSTTQSNDDQRIAKEKSLFAACDKVDKSDSSLQNDYQECIALDIMLQEDVKSDDEGSERQQLDRYYSDLAKIGEANGIRLLGISPSTTAIDNALSLDLKYLMHNAINADIKARAERVYDCYFDNLCHK